MNKNRTNGTHCGRFESIVNRRHFLERAGAGFGSVALLNLLSQQNLLAADSAEESNASPREVHFPAKAKSIIWLFMEGAPSSVDMFDPKPELTKRDGQKIAINVFNGNPGPLMKSPFAFKQYGESGAWVCEKYPNVARHVDDFAFIKSLHSDSNDHVPALYQINTGIARPGFPSAGAWVTYALGSENQNLPGYVVLGNNQGIKGGPLNWHAGFLPSTFQGTLFRPEGNPILNLNRPSDVSREDQRRQLDLLARLNDEHLQAHPGEADLLGRIQSFELAYRMQSDAVSLIDFSTESEATLKAYGLDRAETKSYGSKCLLARRMVESGVRFVQVYSDGEWDAHSDLKSNHTGRPTKVLQHW